MDNNEKRSGSKWLYALLAFLAPVSGAAAGIAGSFLVTIARMIDVRGMTQAEIDEIVEWGWCARFTSDQARGSIIEMFTWISAASVLVFAASVIGLCILTGRFDTDSEGKIRLNWFDRIWSEVQLAAGIFAGVMAVVLGSPVSSAVRYSNWFKAYTVLMPHENINGISNKSSVILCGIGMAILIWIVVTCLVSIVKKIKAGELLNNSLLGKVIRILWHGVKAAWSSLRGAFRGTVVPGDGDRYAVLKLIAKYCLIAAALIIVPFLMLAGFNEIGLIALIIALLAAIYIIVRKVGKLAEIRAGVIAVKSGDVKHKIDVAYDDKGPKTDLDKLASDINTITESMDAAVQAEVKNQRLKTDLISNVSHDLKTPLTSMISYLDILEKEGLDSPDAPAHLAVVKEKTERLRVLTDELFEAAKASSGNIPCEIESIDVAALVDQSLAEMGDRLAARELIIRKSIRTENTRVQADGKLLYRVFENMLSNISKYALEKSRVYIDVSDDPRMSGRTLIEFKNISRDELNISTDELMERFTRGDQSRNTEGSGLGLAIARDLTTLMGGSFDISIDGDMFKASVSVNQTSPLSL